MRKGQGNVAHIYGADFETDNDGVCSAWVVQWALVSHSREWHGRDIGSFFDTLISRVRAEKKVLCYFHNLKYDSSFMGESFHKLIESGWSCSPIIRKRSPIIIRFSLDDMVLEFRDSLKKIPGDLRSIGKLIDCPKLDPPGPEDFAPGWSEGIDYSDPQTWEYVIRDATICQ